MAKLCLFAQKCFSLRGHNYVFRCTFFLNSIVDTSVEEMSLDLVSKALDLDLGTYCYYEHKICCYTEIWLGIKQCALLLYYNIISQKNRYELGIQINPSKSLDFLTDIFIRLRDFRKKHTFTI